MGTIKATNIEPIATNGTVTLGSSGDTITIPSGATLDLSSATQTGVGGNNTPAFHAYLNFYQSLANGTGTKLQFNTEVFDTDNCYDNTTNYRFTPTTAGKYYIFATVQTDSATDFDDYQIILQKNGSVTSQTRIRHHYADNIYSGTIVEANGSTDYFEAFAYQASGGTINATGTSYPRVQFGGYKIIE